MASYATDHWRTIRDFDGSGPGTFSAVSLEEAFDRTRVVNSHMGRAEAERLVARAALRACPWSRVPQQVRLVDADPTVRAGVYDAMLALWDWFWQDREKGM